MEMLFGNEFLQDPIRLFFLCRPACHETADDFGLALSLPHLERHFFAERLVKVVSKGHKLLVGVPSAQKVSIYAANISGNAPLL